MTFVVEVPPGKVGSARYAYDAPQTWESHRWLKVRWRSMGGSRTATVSVGSKTWTITSLGSGAWTDSYVDLMDPATGGAAEDDWQTKRPLISPSDPFPVDEGKLNGVYEVASIAISGLVPDRYEFESITLVVRDFARLYCLSGFKDYTVAHRFANFDVRPYLIGDCDGRLSLEASDSQRIVDFQGFYCVPVSQIGLGTYVADTTGWTWTSLSAYPDGDEYTPWVQNFLNNNRPAVGIGGDGAAYFNGGWNFYQALDVGAAVTLPAQLILDSIEWYPTFNNDGADPFNYGHGSIGGRLFIPCAKVMRHQATGVALQPTGGPLAGATVEWERIDPRTVHGTATSATRGQFSTGLSMGRGGKDYRARLLADPTPLVDKPNAPARTRQRAVFRGEPEGAASGPCNAASRHGWYYRAFTDATGDVLFKAAAFSTPLYGWEVETAVTTGGGNSNPRLAQDALLGRLYLTYAVGGGGLALRTSDDEGETWEAQTVAITGGRFGLVACGEDGSLALMAFKYDSGTSGPGKIYFRFQGPGDAALSAEATVKDSGSSAIAFEGEQFGLCQPFDGQRRWVLAARASGSTDVTEYESFDDCKTFSVVA